MDVQIKLTTSDWHTLRRFANHKNTFDKAHKLTQELAA